MNIESVILGMQIATEFMRYKPPKPKSVVGKPPPISIYKHVVEAYQKHVNDMTALDTRLRQIISTKCKRYSLKTVLEAIAFYGKWMNENEARKESCKFKDIRHFFLFRLDEMVKLMVYRKNKEPKYEPINEEKSRLHDPFAIKS